MELTNKTKKYLEDEIGKNLTKDELNEIFEQFITSEDYIEDEIEINIDEFNKFDIQYMSEENENYIIDGEIARYGGEGQGSDYWTISRILDKKTNKVYYIYFYGYYESWNGVEWEGWHFVKPIKKEIIDFVGC